MHVLYRHIGLPSILFHANEERTALILLVLGIRGTLFQYTSCLSDASFSLPSFKTQSVQ